MTKKGDLLKQDNQGMVFLTNSLDFQKQVKYLKQLLLAYSMNKIFVLYYINATASQKVTF
jgi:hypothetical protein